MPLPARGIQHRGQPSRERDSGRAGCKGFAVCGGNGHHTDPGKSHFGGSWSGEAVQLWAHESAAQRLVEQGHFQIRPHSLARERFVQRTVPRRVLANRKKSSPGSNKSRLSTLKRFRNLFVRNLFVRNLFVRNLFVRRDW
jgi:hypothetical protein